MRSLNVLGMAGLVLGCATFAWAQGAPAPAPAVELKVGDKAPNFKLQGSDGKTYSLADFAGKRAVVVAWFPAAFTKGCTVECKSLAMNGDKIRQFNVAYFMASTDPIEKNTDFAKAQEADFPLLSDPAKEVAAAYGVLNARGTAHALDVLHRHRWPHPRHRQGRARRDVGRRHGGEAGRAERREGEVELDSRQSARICSRPVAVVSQWTDDRRLVPLTTADLFLFSDLDPGQRLFRRPADHFARHLESRAVARAVPRALGVVPVHVAAHVRADG